MITGIDVSHHNGFISWHSFDLDFAIIRCGYGNDSARQDDTRWSENYIEAQARAIPCGVYLYSYARTLEEAESEARHVVRCIRTSGAGLPDLGVWFDAEEQYTTPFTVQAFKKFRSVILAELGCSVGYYASAAWLNRYASTIVNEGFPIWIARYNAALPADYYFRDDNRSKYDIWQYTSTGACRAVAGHVDLNRMNRQALRAVGDVWDGCYGNNEDRHYKLTNALYDAAAVQREVNRSYAIAKRCIAGEFGNGPERVQKLQAAGWPAGLIQRVVNHILEVD